MTAGTLTEQLSTFGTPFDEDGLEAVPQEAFISPQSIFDPKVKAIYDQQPKVRVFIQEPEGWRESYPYCERVQINGIVYIIMAAEEGVLVPESVAGVIKNKRQMNKLADNMQRLASAKAKAGFDAIPWHMRS